MVLGYTGQFLLRYTLYISWFQDIQDSSFSGIHYIYYGSRRYRTVPSQVYITYIMVPGDTGQFLLRYTLHISLFLEIQDSFCSGMHYIYHGSRIYRTVSAQVCITYIMVPGYTGQFLLSYILHISLFQDIQDSSCLCKWWCIWFSWAVYIYISWLFGDDVSGLVELHIYISWWFGWALYIFLGCLVMMYLVWLSYIYIYILVVWVWFIWFGWALYIYLGCLVMMYLVWLSAVCISRLFADDVYGLVELNIYLGCLMMMYLVWLS